MQFSVTDACAGYTRNTVAFRTSLVHDPDDSLEQHSLLFKGQ